ncbi:lipoprotein (plasmid) [Thioalkalivibrio sp. K90mix]|uniref:BspA family leucine-rich repeat surface protein n=1 Tax=Thioalkalivibrio sp. (strain K90mix) TaxID=396595 RepID=UPI0001C65CB7|nr:BspA family leucine-rich repeat surface protein [Thioalkalivibrio sp. K90mix]ADC73133.1 lipoprotein [Thioalkalivibrio sp. K90mix]
MLPETAGYTSAGSGANGAPEAAAEDCYDPDNIGQVGEWSGCEGMLIVDDHMLREAASNAIGIRGDDSFNVAPGDAYAPENLTETFTFEQDGRDVFTGQVVNMSSLFRDSDMDLDIGYWDTSRVESMSHMFRGTTMFNQDIGSWNVTSVITMERMFDSAEAFNQDIGGWDMSNVRVLSSMFRYSGSVFNQDIGGWDTSNVEAFNHMFQRNNAFNQDIGGWDVSSARDDSDFARMFENTDAFDQNLSCWDVEHIEEVPTVFGVGVDDRPRWGESPPC